MKELKSMRKKHWIEGIKDGIPIALGYLSVSFTFGLMASDAGLNPLQAVVISMTNLTSAGQFAGLDIIIAGGSLLEMALTQFIINIRYALMSLSLSQKTNEKFKGLSRVILGFFITDEIFAVSISKKGDVGRLYFLGLATLPFWGWNLGTFLGAILGNILPPILQNALIK